MRCRPPENGGCEGKQRLAAVVEEVQGSMLQKMRETNRLRVLAAETEAGRISWAAVEISERLSDGGKIAAFGNGGSATGRELSLHEIDVLVIENVGNLICSAEFKVGEDARVMVYSITEGEEKPLKYPLFRSADLVLCQQGGPPPTLALRSRAVPPQL